MSGYTPTGKKKLKYIYYMNKVLLWLDDLRDPFEGTWLEVYSPLQSPFETIWVKDYQQFVAWIEINGLPDGICFDHDISSFVAFAAREKGMSKRASRKLKQFEKTGYDAAKWLVDYCLDNSLELPKFNIQSANPAGKENIQKLLDNFNNRAR